MDCDYLIVSSITYAMKAKGELDKNGIYSKVEKVKNVPSLGGCGFGVRVRKANSGYAQRILAVSGIRVLEVIGCEDGRR